MAAMLAAAAAAVPEQPEVIICLENTLQKNSRALHGNIKT
eukprot:COSAG05_NODE_1809_length_4041_cov_4.735921_2_plen_40_part_00